MPAKPPPQPASTASDRPLTGENACSLFRRMLVMLYDAVIVLALMMLATGMVLLVHPPTLMAGKDVWYTLYLVGVWFFYLGWCWHYGGLTLGMRAWRVQLLTDSAKPMSWPQSGLRFAGSILAILPFGAGYFWSLFDPEHRTWHDRWSRSRLCRRDT